MGIRILPYRQGSELPPLIRSFLGPGVNARFIVPSRGDFSWWRRHAGREQQAPCDPQADPVWTWQELYDDIAAFYGVSRRHPFSPPDRKLILRHLLTSALEEDPELVKLWPGLGRAGFLDVLAGDVSELLNEAVSPEKMNVGSEGPMPRLLPKVYARYLNYLEENALLDSAQIWTAALEILKAAEAKRGDGPIWGEELSLVFAGFLSFTHGQLELLRELPSWCQNVTVLKPDPGMRDFYDAEEQLFKNTGLSLDFSPSPEPDSDAGRVLEMPVSDPSLEPEVVARNLALWSSGEGPLAQELNPFPGFESIAILCGEEGPLENALLRYGVPFTRGTGAAISCTLPGQILSSLRSLHGAAFPNRETALLLTQPCFAGLRFSTMDALRLGASGLASWEKQLKGAGEKPAIQVALASIRAIKALCAALSKGGEPLSLMEAFYKFLVTRGLWLDRMAEAGGGNGTDYLDGDETLRLTASAIATVREKVVALRELLPDIGPLGKKPLKGERAWEFLETWCRESNVRPPLPLSGAVRLYSSPPPVLATYPVWIMMGVTQKTWPGPLPSSPLLGEAERRLLDENGAHLPSLQEKSVQREGLFRRLVHTGTTLTVLSCSKTDEEDRPLARSPFINRFYDEMKGWNHKELDPVPIGILTGEKDNVVFQDIDPDPTKPARRFRPSLKDNQNQNISMSFAVSDLRELLGCPLLWWLERRAKLREKDRELIVPREWGNLAHALWEAIWRRYRDRVLADREVAGGALFLEIAEEEWGKLIKQDEAYTRFAPLTARKETGGDPRFRRRLENEEFRFRRLGRYQARILDRMWDAGFFHREIALEEEAHLRCEVGGTTFTGKCDRIEILEGKDGLMALITDYKDGRSESYDASTDHIEGSPWNAERRTQFKKGLQLSAYAVMFTRQRPDVPLGGVCFLGMGDGLAAGTFSSEAAPLFGRTVKDSGALDSRREEAEYAMRCAAALLSSGDFSPIHTSPLCRDGSCAMAGICRRGEFRGETLFNDEDGDAESGDGDGFGD